MALGALAGHRVGFDLGRPLRHQPEGFLDRTGELLLDLAQVLLRVVKDHLQPRVHVLEPGLDFGLGQLRFAQGLGLGGNRSLGRNRVQDTLGEVPVCVRGAWCELGRGHVLGASAGKVLWPWGPLSSWVV